MLDVSAQDPASLLTRILERKISISHVVADRVFTSSKEAADIIKMLSKVAVDLNLSHVVAELGQAEAVGTRFSDILDNVPEVTPVQRAEVSNRMCGIYSFCLTSAQRKQREQMDRIPNCQNSQKRRAWKSHSILITFGGTSPK